MQTIHDMSSNRTVPAVLTVAIHLLLLDVIAISTGIIRAPTELPNLILTPTEPEQPKPPPAPTDIKPLDKHAFIDPDLIDKFTKPPVIVSELPPVGDAGNVIIDAGGDPPEPQIVAPHLLSSAEPAYPNISRLREEQGVVQVRVTISPYGAVGEASIEKSSGFPRLDDAALKAVRQWRFAPAMRGAQAVVGSAVVAVRFQLRS